MPFVLLLTVAIAAIGLSLAWILARGIGRAAENRREVDRLRVSERRTSRIVETAHDAVVSTDSAGRITGWNASAERMFGWTREEALGRDGAETLLPGGLGKGHAGELATVGQRALETVARHRDGRDLPVEVSLAMVRESDGWVFNAFIRDISERRDAQAQLEAAQHEVLRRLAIAAEYRDDATGQHTRRVGELSARLAGHIGSEDLDVDLIRLAAPLHDVGKVGIPDAILLKPARLTEDEFEVVKTHAEMGAEMLAGRGFPLLELAEWIARSHHERWDGSGYPAGLEGEDIPLPGRIVALADTFDALTHERPYKHAWSPAMALEEIRSQRGHQFDPALVDAFLELMRGSGTRRFTPRGSQESASS